MTVKSSPVPLVSAPERSESPARTPTTMAPMTVKGVM